MTKSLTESIIQNIIIEISGHNILYIGFAVYYYKSRDRLLKITESVVGNCN